MDLDILHLQVPFLSECQFTCRLQQEYQYAEREEDDFGQPVSEIAAVGGNGRTTQILRSESRHTLNYTMLKSIFNYHFHYLNLTFIITALNVKICGYSWM